MFFLRLQAFLSSKYFIKVFLTLVITTLVSSMGFGWYYYKKDKNFQQVGELMYKTLLPDVAPELKIKMLENVIEKSFSFRTIAKFKLAEVYLKQKHTEKALGIYRDIVASKPPNFYAELALLHEAILLNKWNEPQVTYTVYDSTYKLLKAINYLNNHQADEAFKILSEIKTNVEVNLVTKNLANLILNSYLP